MELRKDIIFYQSRCETKLEGQSPEERYHNSFISNFSSKPMTYQFLIKLFKLVTPAQSKF